MMKGWWWLLLPSLWVGNVGAAQEVRMELLDGSTLHGEIVGMQDGLYRIRTRHLGVVELPEAEIRALSFSAGAVGTGTESRPVSSQIEALQQGLISDERSMAMIMELIGDPQFQAVLNDPDLMQAVTAGDLGALSSHPAIIRLLRDPRIRAIQQQSGMVPSH